MCIATSGTLTLAFRQQTTAAIAFDATAFELETAIELLASMDDVTLTFSSGTSQVLAAPCLRSPSAASSFSTVLPRA